MIASLRFLHATLVHKWYVYQAGRRLRLGVWQLLRHDLSKFRPSEFVPYGRFFYAKPGAGWLKAVTDPEAKSGMQIAWLRHIQRNPHHWQHWCLIKGASIVASRGTTDEVNQIEALPMPVRYVREMLADWMAACRAYQGEYPKSIADWRWWQENKSSIILHPTSREHLTEAIMTWFHPNSSPVIGYDEAYVWGEPGEVQRIVKQ